MNPNTALFVGVFTAISLLAAISDISSDGKLTLFGISIGAIAIYFIAEAFSPEKK